MSDQYRVTSVGITPAEDRAHRMRLYFIAMSIRVLCIVSLFWVRGWWILLVGAGAVLLPYFAVMWANAVDQGKDGERPDAPEPLALSGESVTRTTTASPHDRSDRPDTATIIVDAPEYRRGTGSDDTE